MSVAFSFIIMRIPSARKNGTAPIDIFFGDITIWTPKIHIQQCLFHFTILHWWSKEIQFDQSFCTVSEELLASIEPFLSWSKTQWLVSHLFTSRTVFSSSEHQLSPPINYFSNNLIGSCSAILSWAAKQVDVGGMRALSFRHLICYDRSLLPILGHNFTDPPSIVGFYSLIWDNGVKLTRRRDNQGIPAQNNYVCTSATDFCMTVFIT